MPAVTPRRPAAVRLALAGALTAAAAVLAMPGPSTASPAAATAAAATSAAATAEPPLRPTPQARCNAGSRPETSIQGRVPQRDYTNGRAARGYTCNTRQVGRYGDSGGFKVFRYVDRAGNVCAIFDSTLLAPTDVPFNVGQEGLGTIVLDMSDPSRPRKTANLPTLAMQSPHESLFLNRRRGLLAAVWGNPGTAPGQVDVYSVRNDCRSPRLLSTLPTQGFGHESDFAPDGRTFYISGTSGETLQAIDLTDPTAPSVIARQDGVGYHGLRLSADGRRMYVADLGSSSEGALSNVGLRILDVSSIQDREPDMRFRRISDLTWRQVSIPQAADPITVDGRKLLLETDEFSDLDFAEIIGGLGYDDQAVVGAARLIDIENERRPFVVSNLRLAVHQRANRDGPQRNDPGASLPVQGYAAHYCSAPRRTNPGIVACSMIASGLRIFDVRDPERPREVGYFNKPRIPDPRDPLREGGWAMSAPAYDLKNRMVWYTDGNTGFYAVRLAKSIVPRHYWAR